MQLVDPSQLDYEQTDSCAVNGLRPINTQVPIPPSDTNGPGKVLCHQGVDASRNYDVAQRCDEVVMLL
jgi:hypothetical protein